MEEEIHKTLENISADKTQNRKVTNISNKLLKKISLKSSSDLEKLQNILYLLFINNSKKHFEDLASVIVKLNFNGNYNLWTWIESMLALITLETENTVISTTAYNKISENYNDDKKAKDSILNGELLHLREVEESLKEGNEKNINEWKTILLSDYVLIKALGKSPKYSCDFLQKEIESLRVNLKNS
ncbi:DUF6707 family protein [Dysgonomonas sp. 25]|uniref:DUF6707 family protein n=1 Tax=Dysgonomonas sp. 25 TaxID=2302933 RepID=UPI0013D275E7|nr:DUF6707 family protein [Dysgonomonas sp. 25]NDV68288.1 hypothetical protein [Dysgonomonas sp. 25]